jgi:hypothetical protein
MLVVGLVGVLWLNTLTDQAGIQTNDTRASTAKLQVTADQLHSDIAYRSATPAIAEQARKLGLVPAGDAAILVVPPAADGSTAAPTVIGTPTPVPAPAAPPTSVAPAAAVTVTVATTAAANQ